MNAKRKPRLKIWFVGGAGINISEYVYENNTIDTAAYDVELVRVDTSKSNIENSDAYPTYLIPGLDGVGQLKSKAHTHVGPHVKEILQEHKVGEFNIIVGSASGGSGSVIMLFLLAELKNRGENVLAMVIGSTTSRTFTKNTISTLRELQKTATRSVKKPFVISYFENVSDTNSKHYNTGTRVQVNECIAEELRLLSIFFSDSTKQLDNDDKINLLDYTKVLKDQSPNLVDLEIRLSFYETNALTHATVQKDKDGTFPTGSLYTLEGFFDETQDDAPEIMSISTMPFLRESRLTQLQNKLSEFDEIESSIKQANDVVLDDDDDDLIF